MRPISPSERAAEAFVVALTQRDFDALEDVLDPEVRFRVLVPSGIREAADAHLTMEWLHLWFGESGPFEVVGWGVGGLGTQAVLWYRFALERDGVPCVIEQKGFLDASGGKASDVSLVCSGFQPLSTIHHAGEPVEVAVE